MSIVLLRKEANASVQGRAVQYSTVNLSNFAWHQSVASIMVAKNAKHFRPRTPADNGKVRHGIGLLVLQPRHSSTKTIGLEPGLPGTWMVSRPVSSRIQAQMRLSPLLCSTGSRLSSSEIKAIASGTVAGAFMWCDGSNQRYQRSKTFRHWSSPSFRYNSELCVVNFGPQGRQFGPVQSHPPPYGHPILLRTAFAAKVARVAHGRQSQRSPTLPGLAPLMVAILARRMSPHACPQQDGEGRGPVSRDATQG